MTHDTHCKFCQKPLTLEIDAEYSALGDPLKLIPFAACNHCADVRTRRRSLEDAIGHICMTLARSPRPTETHLERVRSALVNLTKKYSRLVSDWLGSTNVWDVECVNLMLEKPESWSQCLDVLWRIGKNEQVRREHEVETQ